MFYPLSKTFAWVANPSAWAFALVLGAVVASRRPRWAAFLAGTAALQLLAFSSPRVVDLLQARLEADVPHTFRADVHYDAAIVLGGSDDRIGTGAEVVRAGAGRQMVYTGVLSRHGERGLRGELHRRGIRDEQIVIEDRARNTYENAVEAARLASEKGWRSLLLVTSTVHVPRALACFRRQGLEPDVLPVADDAGPRERGWMPRRSALEESRAMLHEVIGRVVYRALGYAA